jgi:[ribosomal protein S5]-alanine N-acetyltransferase
VTGDIEPVRSERLDLISVGIDFVRAALGGNLQDAERYAGVRLPPGWNRDAQSALRYRRAQMEADPSTRPWLLRLIVVRDIQEMAGYINFHAPPEGRGWVEIGYQIQPQFRRRGYAFEAAIAMFLWASERGVDSFRASVSPQNEPSLAMVRKMGFTRVGQQWDDIDGLEYVFEASLADVQRAEAAARAARASEASETGADR